jgi:hypothetical protein
MKLERIDGVSTKKANSLRDYGYETVEDVAFASLMYFEDVPNTTPKTIKKAQKLLRDDPDVGFQMDDPVLNSDFHGNYYCGECGQNFNKAFQTKDKWHNCDPDAKLRRSNTEGRP